VVGNMQESIPITRHTHRCPWLGLRWLEVARPCASTSRPATPPAVGHSDEAVIGWQATELWPALDHT
jgi:hypothetical protein